MAKNNHGFAALESVYAGLLLFTFVVAILMAAYFQFGQAWIQYQSEQTLYCLAQGQSQGLCRKDLKTKIEKFLPWGDWKIYLERQRDQWNVEIVWQYEKYTLHFKKELNVALLTAKKGSHL